jgi:hypothetical protein
MFVMIKLKDVVLITLQLLPMSFGPGALPTPEQLEAMERNQ